MKRMLGIFAHPPDGMFACGGTFAKYAKTGATIDLICATGRPSARQELQHAATLIGCSSVTFLDYKEDSLAARNPGEIEDILFRKMVELTPNIVITFELGGINHNPDHMKMTTATTVAFQKYAVKAVEVVNRGISPLNPPRHPRDAWQISFAEAVAGADEPELYYACISESAVDYLINQKVIPQELFGKRWTGTPDKMITTVIDIEKFQRVKRSALAALVSNKEENYASLVQEFFYLRMRGTHEVFMGKNDRVANRL